MNVKQKNIFKSIACLMLLIPTLLYAKVIVQWDEVFHKDDQLQYEKYIQNNFKETFTYEEISTFIKTSHLRFPIQKISIEKSNENYIFTVSQKIFLNQIEFAGNQKVSSKRLFEASQFSGGKYYADYEIDSIIQKIEKYYQERSFWNVSVDFSLLKFEKKNKNYIQITVLEGASCEIKNIQINYSDEQRLPRKINRKFPIQVGELCDEIKIKDKLRSFNNKVRSYGYKQFNLEDVNLNFSPQRKQADLVLDVFVGKKVSIEFKNNTFIFERDAVLLNELSIEAEKVFGETWLKFTAVPSIKKFYAAIGYPFAEVSHSTYNFKNELKVVFDIHRGDRFFLGDINFVEINNKSKINLNKIFKQYSLEQTRKGVFVKQEFEQSLDSMLSYYQSQGFIKTLTDDLDFNYKISDRTVHVKAVFNVGEKALFKKFNYSGNTVFTNDELDEMFGFENAEAINPSKLANQVELLKLKYQRLGYKNIDIVYPKIEFLKEGDNIIAIEVSEGKKIFIGKISIEGNQTTKKRIIYKNLNFKQGDVLDPEKIRSSRRNLLQSGFFESVFIDTRSKPVKQFQDVIIRLKERKKKSVILRPGFSTDDGMRARVEYRHINIGGTGRQLNLFTHVNRKFNDRTTTERRLGLTYIEPFLIGRSTASFSVLSERIDDQQFDLDRNLFRVGFENSFIRKIRPRFNWILEFREPFNVESGASLNPIDEQAARFGSLIWDVDVDLRDDFLNPVKGTYHQFKFELYDKAFLSEEEFWKLYVKNNFYWPIYKRLRSVLSLRVGFSKTYGDTEEVNIPIEKRFRVGGSSSFRGSRFNCIGGVTNGDPENCSNSLTNQAPGGNSLFNYLFEVLIPLSESLDFALFTDGGNAYLTNGDFDIFNIRNAAGAGIRFNTFFGPMRFDYGILLDRREGESLGTFHFSVGQF